MFRWYISWWPFALKLEYRVRVFERKDPEANIWAPNGLRTGSGEDFPVRKFIDFIVHLIHSG